MGRRATSVNELKAQARERLEQQGLPGGAVLFPRHLFNLLGRSRTYFLIRTGEIRAYQDLSGATYTITLAEFLDWLYDGQPPIEMLQQARDQLQISGR